MSKTCEFRGCVKPLKCKGLCSAHYQQHLKSKPLTQLRTSPGTHSGCVVAGCKRPNKARGLCEEHYTRQRRQSLPDCTVSGCSKQQISGDLCSMHYDRKKSGRPLELMSRYESLAAEMAQGLRTCSRCGETLKLSKFYKSTKEPSGLASRCIKCHSAVTRERKYGISEATWEALFIRQGMVCAICGTDDPGARGWATDHDHRGEHGRSVRGITCFNCNTSIGYIESHLGAHLEKALAYLSSPPYWLTDAEESQSSEFYGGVR